MNYPFWDIPFGYGMMMATVATIHVFVAHFAIGGGLYLVVNETLARRNRDQLTLDFLKTLSRFFVLVTLVFGALTGVAIWFMIGLLNPAATEVLIHHFVWGWATEWCFFAIEILAAILYYYGWERMSARNHLILGWIYFIAAWMSLFVINGILSFMLTPDGWLTSGSFFDGFFNATFWSSTVLRTGICIMLAGLYSTLVVSRYKKSDFKAGMIRLNAVWGLVGLAIMWPAFVWFWESIPDAITTLARQTMPTTTSSEAAAWWFGELLLIGFLLVGLLLRKRVNLVMSIIMMALGLAWFGSFEWMRESIRKPYVIYDYMYGNGLELARADTYSEDGLLPHIKYRTGDDGADLFRRACRSCHTIDGYHPLKPGLDGANEVFIAGLIKGAHVIKGNMPPFLGTEVEANLIASHLYKQLDHRSLKDIYGLEGVELGRKVYEIRCGKCHEFYGFNDKSESLLDLEPEDIHDILDMAGDFADEMPPFTGDSTEREALIDYLQHMTELAAEATE